MNFSENPHKNDFIHHHYLFIQLYTFVNKQINNEIRVMVCFFV